VSGQSVRIAQTRSGLALISTVELTVFSACSSREAYDSYCPQLSSAGQCAEGWPREGQESCPLRARQAGQNRCSAASHGQLKMAADLQRTGWRDMTVQFPKLIVRGFDCRHLLHMRNRRLSGFLRSIGGRPGSKCARQASTAVRTTGRVRRPTRW
jgi:hypothetical protein